MRSEFNLDPASWANGESIFNALSINPGKLVFIKNENNSEKNITKINLLVKLLQKVLSVKSHYKVKFSIIDNNGNKTEKNVSFGKMIKMNHEEKELFHRKVKLINKIKITIKIFILRVFLYRIVSRVLEKKFQHREILRA